MYTSYIGRQFIELYNEKTNSDFTAERFFEEKFFPIFFNDDRHLMDVHNSAFAKQNKVSKNFYEKHPQLTENEIRLIKFKNSINEENPNGSTLVGYKAKELTRETSGQVSSFKNVMIDSEEIYASWIGEALAIGVSGGNVFLINENEVLWQIYQGWEYYRKYINQTPNIKDRQIETWNGNWLIFSQRDSQQSKIPEISVSKVKGKLAIATASWSQVLFGLSHYYPNKEILIYAYSLSSKNTTLGFIKVFLPEFNKLLKYRHSLIEFKEFKQIDNKDIEQFETFYSFKVACQKGSIGLFAIEPKGLRKFMPYGTSMNAQGKELKFNKNNDYFLYQIYKNWIMATLNKTKLLQLASQLAEILLNMEEEKTSRGKADIYRISQEVRESKTIKEFISKLTETIPLMEKNASIIKEVVTEILEMPNDNFPLFIILVRFEYNYQKTLK